MKATVLIFLFAFPAALAAQIDPSDPDAFVPATNLRKEIHAIYRYEPQAATPAPAAPFLAPRPAAPAQTDFVESAPVQPQNSREMNRLAGVIVQEQVDAKAALVAKNLGIGLVGVPLGRHWFVGAATAFYIPVMIGIGASW
jgi:hypothetical protein